MAADGHIDKKDSRSSNCIPQQTNKSSEVDPKKPKIKTKAAKVFKFVLDFLQIKHKKKHEEKEDIASPPEAPENSEQGNVENQDGAPELAESDTQVSTDPGLSLSWSYLVHDTSSAANLDSRLPDDVYQKSGIFYQESYFEDDYWQDYYEFNMTPVTNHWVTTDLPSVDLATVDRTVCGELKRIAASYETPRRRHASLPNVTLAETGSMVETESAESEDVDTDDLMDYNKLIGNRPALGLSIAFDTLLDKAAVYDTQVCYFNQRYATDDDYMIKEDLHDSGSCHFRKFEPIMGHAIFDYVETPKSSHNSMFEKQRLFNTRPKVWKPFEDKLVIGGFQDNHSSASELGCEHRSHNLQSSTLEVCIPDSPVSSVDCIPCIGCNLSVKNSSEAGAGVESGYSSTDVSPCSESSTSVPNFFGDAQDRHRHRTKEPPKSLRFQPKATSSLINGDTHSLTEIETSAVSVSTLHGSCSSALSSQPVVQSTECPSNVPFNLQKTLAYDQSEPPLKFLSPICQQSEQLKYKKQFQDYIDNLTTNNQIPKGLHLPVCPKYLLLDSNKQPDQGDSRTSRLMEQDYHVLIMAANFITNRIKYKEELKSLLHLAEVVRYLNSYYRMKISQLSNRNVQSIVDYRKTLTEACMVFTSERLSNQNCYCELLSAILVNHSSVTAECEDFIFENLSYFVGSQDFIDAPSELILMILCNNRCAVLGPEGFPMSHQESELEVRRALRRYIDIHRTGHLDKYLKVKQMFSFVIDQRSAQNGAAKVANSRMSSKNDVYVKSRKSTAKTCDSPVESENLGSDYPPTQIPSARTIRKLCGGTPVYQSLQSSYRRPRSSVSQMVKMWLDYAVIEQKSPGPSTVFSKIDTQKMKSSPQIRSSHLRSSRKKYLSLNPDSGHSVMKSSTFEPYKPGGTRSSVGIAEKVSTGTGQQSISMARHCPLGASSKLHKLSGFRQKFPASKEMVTCV